MPQKGMIVDYHPDCFEQKSMKVKISSQKLRQKLQILPLAESQKKS